MVYAPLPACVGGRAPARPGRGTKGPRMAHEGTENKGPRYNGGWEGPAGRRGPAELRVWATEQCVGGLRASWGPPVTAGLPGADQSVAREPPPPPAQPAGGAEAEAGEKDPWPPPAPRTLVWGGRRRQRVSCEVQVPTPCSGLPAPLPAAARHHSFCQSRWPRPPPPPGSQSAASRGRGRGPVSWLVLGCGQARGRPAPPQGRKGVFWKPGGGGGLCTSRPSPTPQPGPGSALGSEHPHPGASDAGSWGSHTLRRGKTFKDLGQENRRPVGGAPAGSQFKAIAHERVGAPLGGGGSSALPRGSQPGRRAIPGARSSSGGGGSRSWGGGSPARALRRRPLGTWRSAG